MKKLYWLIFSTIPNVLYEEQLATTQNCQLNKYKND